VPALPPGLKLPASLDPETGEWRDWDQGIKRYKVPPEEHLKAGVQFKDGTSAPGLNLIDGEGQVTRRTILIGNRNLGNNYGFVAWHHEQQPRCFHLLTEPIGERTYTCLTSWKDHRLSIEPIRFQPTQGALSPTRDGRDLSEEIVWCTYGQQVLRNRRLVCIEEIIDEFYDARHALYYPASFKAGEAELRELYESYPGTFRARLVKEWEAGRPRSRYLHNAVGIGPDRIVILQRHGTIEEIGLWLKAEGAEDGIILDNGGSVFTWAWWPTREVIKEGDRTITKSGHVIYNAPDWRPPTISLIAFVLKGPARHVEPSGSVAFSLG
jgi:hypothetical protein